MYPFCALPFHEMHRSAAGFHRPLWRPLLRPPHPVTKDRNLYFYYFQAVRDNKSIAPNGALGKFRQTRSRV